MDIRQETQVTVTVGEIVTALRAAHPDNLDIQRLPLTGKGVELVPVAGGARLKFSVTRTGKSSD